jgi:predicted nucleic acid-binding Zn ribbon protein
MKALEDENKDLEERLETHKLVDRAKGKLMDELDMKENDAFPLDPAPGHGRKDVHEGRCSKGAGRQPPPLSCARQKATSAQQLELGRRPLSGVPDRLSRA